MSETAPTPEADKTATFNPATTTAQAVAGDVNPAMGGPVPQFAAAPAADQPAAGQQAIDPEPAGQAPAEPVESHTATHGATDIAAELEQPQAQVHPAAVAGWVSPLREGRAGRPEVHPDVHTNINAIEQLALFWGGETAAKIRNHIGRIRELLQ